MGRFIQKKEKRMNPKTCMMCGAQLKETLSSYVEDLGGCVVIVKHVPSLQCTQCGETYYTPAVSKRLDEILTAVKATMSEVTIIEYHPAA